jgi:hypothetical protein
MSGQVAVFELEGLIDKIIISDSKSNKCYCSDFNPKCEYCKEKDNLSQHIVKEESNNSTSFDNSKEGVSHSNTMGTHANRPADDSKASDMVNNIIERHLGDKQ